MNVETKAFIQANGEFHRGHPMAREWTKEEVAAHLKDTWALIKELSGSSVIGGIDLNLVDADVVAEWVVGEEGVPED